MNTTNPLINLSQSDTVVTIELNRPQSGNALTQSMVETLSAIFFELETSDDVRAVVLSGSGQHFCAGGDIKEMCRISQSNEGQTTVWNFNRSFGRLVSRVTACPHLVIALVHGSVLGGGFGLTCGADLVVAHKDTMFSMPETKLGIVPAQIAPFVVQRIGLTQARRLALLGEKIDASTATDLGLVHYLSDSHQHMQQQTASIIKQIKQCAPQATAATKKLMMNIEQLSPEQLLDHGADVFCAALTGPEGQEGVTAFMQKRKPSWTI